MDKPEATHPFSAKSRQIIHLAIQLLALAFLIRWCFLILTPFITPIIWAAILAVALYPLHQRLKKLLKGRGVLAAILMTVFFLLFFISIVSWLGFRTGTEIKEEITSFREGKLKIPPPSENVKEWPLIGGKAFQAWTQLSNSVENFLQQYPEQIKSAGNYLLGLVTSSGKAILIFLFSIIISGVFLCYATKSAEYARKFFTEI
jgi:predicted PurR-regulated permease PerM